LLRQAVAFDGPLLGGGRTLEGDRKRRGANGWKLETGKHGTFRSVRIQVMSPYTPMTWGWDFDQQSKHFFWRD